MAARGHMLSLAFELLDAVEAFVGKVRRFFYDVMLSDHVCPSCAGALDMIGESRCRCTDCGGTLDPTVAFQRCSRCGGQVKLRVRRYRCTSCGHDVTSRFIFDGLVFDADYFRKKMAQSRERKQEQRERVRQMLAECRSAHPEPTAADLDSVPGLTDALNALVREGMGEFARETRPRFDLVRYQQHLQAHIGPVELAFDEIPSLAADVKQDRVWRFIAIIFMAHTGLLDTWQNGSTIMVVQHEAH